MRIMTKRTVNRCAALFPKARRSLFDWYRLAESAAWTSPQDVKATLGSASIINRERVVFNIHGNDYRLVVAIDYSRQWLFVKWFGTHADYDIIDVATITWEEPT
jgi:mRNA interferase HigB